jgi:hypothetical protein
MSSGKFWNYAFQRHAANNRMTFPRRVLSLTTLGLAAASFSLPVAAQDSREAELAKKLSNPVANLISVPFQFNYNGRINPRNSGESYTLNFQPVIPIQLNHDWNLISRTILPLTSQSQIFPGSGTQRGTGDTLQSLFLSPSQPTADGLIWGLGPAISVPTGSERLLTSGQWSAGPTGVALVQKHGWTVGVLANHVWSFAETVSNAAPVNQTFVQPFISYTTHDYWTFTLNTESTYNWQTSKLSVPINFMVSKLVKIGELPVSFGVGARYYALSPESGPKGWGARASVTFLFPTK